MYTTFIACIAITFLLSYPPTDYIVHGIESDIHFDLAMARVPFVLLTVLLGSFLPLGNASVYRHIPARYPAVVGPVAGLAVLTGPPGASALPCGLGCWDGRPVGTQLER